MYINRYFLFNRLRDSPNEVDLPVVEEYKEDSINPFGSTVKLTTRQLLEMVFINRLMWYVCMANMCLYLVRLGYYILGTNVFTRIKRYELISGSIRDLRVIG